jgi:hypothetical protein
VEPWAEDVGCEECEAGCAYEFMLTILYTTTYDALRPAWHRAAIDLMKCLSVCSKQGHIPTKTKYELVLTSLHSTSSTEVYALRVPRLYTCCSPCPSQDEYHKIYQIKISRKATRHRILTSVQHRIFHAISKFRHRWRERDPGFGDRKRRFHVLIEPLRRRQQTA